MQRGRRRPGRVVRNGLWGGASAEGVGELPVAGLLQTLRSVYPPERRLCAAAVLGPLTRRFAPRRLRPTVDLLPARLPQAAVHPGNGGCLTQLRAHLADLPMLHTMQVLDRVGTSGELEERD